MTTQLAGVTSRYTSFVASDVKDDKDSVDNWVMETRYVPTQIAHGFGGYDVGRRVRSRRSTPASENSRLSRQLHCSAPIVQPLPSRHRSSQLSSSYAFISSTPGVLLQNQQQQQSLGGGFSRPSPNASFSSTPQVFQLQGGRSMNKMLTPSPGPLMQLINLQSYDGSFALNEALASILKKTLTEMKAGKQIYKVFDFPIYMTIFYLYFSVRQT